MSAGLKSIAKGLCPPLLWRLVRSGYRRLVPPPPPPPAPPPPYRLLADFAELDEALRQARAVRANSDELFRTLDGFRFPPPTDLPADPHSPEYRAAQMDFYRAVARRDYVALECEQCDFGELNRTRPFPYYTRSFITVGEQLVAVGFLIRAMALAPPGHVLEIGCGYGQLTVEMGRMGLDVTAVDVNPRFVDLVNARCQREDLPASAVCCPMREYRPGRRFDRVVFYESFHHCDDHVEMIARLGELVADGGAVVFAGEPIYDDFAMPWGVRRDGRSLWGSSEHGWLELGFRTDYFLGLLARHGWRAEVFDSADAPWQRVFVARRA